jgi:hypothetical protein
MHRSTSLIRIRFPHDLVDRLDRLAERLRLKDSRRIPRAALVRALVQMHMGAADEDRQDITNVLIADPVKRGREKGPQGRRRANHRDYRSASRA